jgi:conjugal transfer pilus assembly protein TraF
MKIFAAHSFANYLIASTLFLSLGAQSAQDDVNNSPVMKLEEGYGDAFLNYQPYVVQGKKQKSLPTPPIQATPLATKKPEKQKADVAWLRKNMPVLHARFIDNPSKENAAAHLYVQRVALDKAQRAQETLTQVINEDPLLNENNRVPYASMGSQSIRNADYLAQQQAVREMSEQGGMVLFVDSACRFCTMQIPIVTTLKNNYGIEALVVSIDGKTPRGYTGPIVTDNGLFKKLGLKLTPSLVYVPRPRGYTGAVDPNQYLIVSQGFYAADELVKMLAFAGHGTKLLSKETVRDLDVWTQGVAATADLRSLELDVNDPASIKKTLQPLLLKQYR